MKPKKAWRVIFKISFIPYVLGILWAIWNAINGLQMEGYIYYGIIGFWTTIKLIFVAFCIKIPIIPIALIYEIFYIVLCKKMKKEALRRKKKAKKQEIKYNF